MSPIAIDITTTPPRHISRDPDYGERQPTEYFPALIRQKYFLGEFAINHASQNILNDTLAVTDDSKLAFSLPNIEDYGRKVSESNMPKPLGTVIPAEWPSQVDAPSVWNKDTINQEDQYVVELTQAHKEDLLTALRNFQESNINLPDITKENFHLPILGKVLEQISERVHDGEGFVLLRGLTPDAFTMKENITLAAGISAYVGGKFGRQSQNGGLITHLTTLKGVKTSAGYYTTYAQPFHNDHFSDIISMYCLSPAASGGQVRLASASKTYNDIAKERPDMIPVLADNDWVHETGSLGPILSGQKTPTYIKRPLLYKTKDGKPFFCFSQRSLTGSKYRPRLEEIPPIPKRQVEAIDMFQATAEKNAIEFDLQAGDILFINNFAVFHSRRDFQDDEKSKRHMLRFWSRHPTRAWQLPDSLKILWDRVYMDLPNVPGWFMMDPLEQDPKVLKAVMAAYTDCGG